MKKASNEKSLIGNNALFEINEADILPENLDEKLLKEKDLYVKVRCTNKKQVENIIKVFEKMDVDKNRIVISA